MSKQIDYPTDFDTFQEAISIAIEAVTNNPLKNKNKLNEVTAKALNFKNYDSISPLVKEEKNIIYPINVYFGDCYGCDPIIDGECIDDAVFSNELVEYTIRDLEEEVNNLITWISECNNSDKQLMINDLKMLMSWNDTFVFSSISTNEYISPTEDTERWNEICEDILKANKELKDKKES